MNSALMFSKASDEWTTPQDFYDRLHAEFDFCVDAAATAENRKCPSYLGLDHIVPSYRDALTADWARYGSMSRLWLNPPYSKCREFMAKAAAERLRGVLTVALVPSRTDTRWFHESIWDAATHAARPGIELRFVRGRVKFGHVGTYPDSGAIQPSSGQSAPFPSMVVVFRP